ncbi:MAG: MarR family transcriptional regulator [Chloroflexaceae bacterium]|nr:MarR family transcriptional regulator [Chloroflexaceae bacterium]
MLDTRLQYLLRSVIDSPVKLHILLTLHIQVQGRINAEQLSERLCRDVWSVSQALREMAEDGLLEVLNIAGSSPAYRFQPRSEYIVPINDLINSYDDPIARSMMHHILREMSGYTAVRRASHVSNVW